MITLYQASGAGGFELTGKSLTDDEFLKLKSSIIRFFKANKQEEEIKAFQSFQFELSDGVNYFGDEFMVLHATVSIEQYAKITKTKNILIDLTYRKIVTAFEELGIHIRFIAIYASTDTADTIVESPTPKITSRVVEQALRDSENLLLSSGAVSAVDRIHTALHGYLKAVCNDEEIKYPSDANLPFLFGLIREKHPRLQINEPRDPDILRILRSNAAIIEAINNIRNRGSIAHPSDNLIDEPEAVLVINSVRTILHYLNAKLGT